MTKIECVHCGEDCGRNPIMFEGKPFCCNGCVNVYKLLNDNKLYKYYELENTPGVKIDEKIEASGKFSFLDLEEVKTSLLEFSEGGISKITFYIPAIHCSSCIWLLENLYRLHKSILQSTVNFVKKEVYITFKNENISLRQVAELLASLHYTPLITLANTTKKASNSYSKQLLYKIGVAGFAFGNTMLFSMPEYLPGKELLGNEFRLWFGILNFLLALPVIFYCASDYFLSAYKNLKHKVLNIDFPISIGIIAIFLESSWVIFQQTGPGYMDSLAGLLFFLLVGKWYQNRTYQALSFERDYKSYFPVAVTVLENGEEKNVMLKNLQVNQQIVIRNLELIPADALIVEGEANIDYSFVSGEATAVQKKVGEEVFAGGRQIGTAIILEVTKEVAQSKLTKLWNQDHHKPAASKSIITTIDKVSRFFTFFVLSVAVLSAVFWAFFEPALAVRVFSSVLIVACPCALALSVPFSFGNTMRIFGRLGFYLKETDVVEKFNSITTIVFDKTGTITKSQNVEVQYNGEPLSDTEWAMIKALTKHSTHPQSAVIYNWCKSNSNENVVDYKEFAGKGIEGTINETNVKLGSFTFTNSRKTEHNPASSRVYVSFNGHNKGFFSLSNSYREGVEDIIATLGKTYDLHLLSGDNANERAVLQKWFPNKTQLHFEQSPEMKRNYIEKLRNENHNVLMIGDGLNDAGALNNSNVGISIADNIYHFSPACDAILEAEKFRYLTKFIHFSKISMKVVRISLFISLLYNIIGLSFAVRGLLSPVIAAILMPASSVTVVAFVTAATSLLSKKWLK